MHRTIISKNDKLKCFFLLLFQIWLSSVKQTFLGRWISTDGSAWSLSLSFHQMPCFNSRLHVTERNTGCTFWSEEELNSTCISAAAQIALWPMLPLRWRGKKEGVRYALRKAFDYSALWLCVGGEGKSRHILRGQAGQIPQEENVETKAETWELRNPPCSSRCTQH